MFRIKRTLYLVLLITFFAAIFCENHIAIAQTEPPHYRIGPNDVLSILVWREEELTRDVTVMADGRISFPLIGSIMAQGKTVSELKDMITKELKNFIDAPQVSVIVNESRSRIYTIGNVTTPGPYPLEANMTVLQALSTAGGFTEWADSKDILVIRRQGGKEEQYHFNYKEFIGGKNLEQNIVLQANDTIVVP